MAAVLVAVLAARPAFAAGGGLQIFPDWTIVGILVVAFALLILPVNRLLLAPILGVLEERERRIEGARAKAAEVESEANRVLTEYEASVRRAREDATAMRRDDLDRARGEEKETVAGARREAESELERVRGEVADALGAARATLRRDAEELARHAAEQILGRSLA